MSSSTGRILGRQVKRERAAILYSTLSRHPEGNVGMLEADISEYIPRAERVIRGFVSSTPDSRTRTRRNLAFVEEFVRELQNKGGHKEF